LDNVLIHEAVKWMIIVLSRFARDIKEMIGHEPHKYWKIMWKFVAPVFIAILLAATLISKFIKPITYSVYSYTKVNSSSSNLNCL
jgi:SNF family Na+-dependent transporter